MDATQRMMLSISAASVYRTSVSCRMVINDLKKPVRSSRNDFVVLALEMRG